LENVRTSKKGERKERREGGREGGRGREKAPVRKRMKRRPRSFVGSFFHFQIFTCFRVTMIDDTKERKERESKGERRRE
jgi:hypothetical protein